MEWIEDVMMTQESNISPQCLQLIQLVDTADEAVEIINEFYSKYLLSPNF
jgi:predicted Rossmann-fold nucleotide-binding protein